MAIILKLENKNHSSTAQNPPIYIEDVVKNIRQDENLTTNLESSSLLWKVTIPHDDANIPTIIKEEEWKAELYYEWEDEETHIIYKETYFTGYLSDSISWVIDQNGQSALQVTLEDNGVHLLKQPYTKNESEVISGDFSSLIVDSQTHIPQGVVQKICKRAGIEWIQQGLYTDNTQVECVADPAESCESLLKAVCKEFCVAYTFDAYGKLYLTPLSHTDVEHEAQEEIDDTDIYDSINLSKKTVTYKGSRIEWDDLDTINQTLVYRDISKPSGSTAQDCEIPLTAGETYPSRDGANTYIKACDIVRGADVFSISNLTPEISWTSPGAGTAAPFRIYGANEIEIKITCTSSGTINKLQAYADLRYVKSKNVVYGKYNTDTPASITEALREEKCRWIHSSTPAEKYANFLAQYDRYCNRTFTFKAKATYNLGQVIHLHENVHTGLTTYLMITKRTRTLTGFNTTTRTFTGIWTYEAVSMSNFDFSQGVTTENLWVPPSTSYVDVSGIETDYFTLSTDKSFLVANYRSSANQTLTIQANISGNIGTITPTAFYSTGESITVTPDPQIANKWSITIPENIPYSTSLSAYPNSINIIGTAGGLSYTTNISINDETIYYKYLGEFTDDNACIGSGTTILVGDFYLNSSTGITRECYTLQGSSRTPDFQDMPLTNAENAQRFLTSLYSATRLGIDLTSISNPNTVAWFNTIIASKAVIDNLFSKYITILNGGSIHSSAYSDTGTYIGSGSGFYLGSDGSLKCYSADMNDLQAVNANISGNSTFHGSFDCTIIKTTPESPSTYITLNGSVADGAQAKRLTDQMYLNGLITNYATAQTTSPMFPIQIVGVSGISYMQVAYQGGAVQSGTTRYRSTIRFYDSSRTEVDIRNYVTCSKSSNLNWSRYLTSSNYDYGSDTSYHGQWASNGIQIRVLTGQDRLWIDVPSASSASVLSSGMMFRADSATTISGVSGYPLYMKA